MKVLLVNDLVMRSVASSSDVWLTVFFTSPLIVVGPKIVNLTAILPPTNSNCEREKLELNQHRQTPTDTGRHRQTLADTGRHWQTLAGTSISWTLIALTPANASTDSLNQYSSSCRWSCGSYDDQLPTEGSQVSQL